AGPLVAPVLLLAAVVAASAQQGHSVTGTVTAGSDTGVQSPVAAATVQVKGMGIETVTDAQGRFTITAPTPNDTLVVTSIGYATSEVPIDGRGVINVVLREQAVALEGLVVVGYGVQERASLSG